MNQLEVILYTGLDALPPSYRSLFSQAGEISFFLSHDWFKNFEKTVLKAQGGARVYGVESSSNPVAALVTRLGRQSNGPLDPVRLELLGNYYTSLHGLVSSGLQDDTAAIAALVKACWTDRRHWDVLDLHPLDIQGAQFTVWVEALRRQGFPVQTYLCFGNWYLNVAGRSYTEYFAALSSSLRKNILYYTRKLERNPNSRIVIIRDGDLLNQSLQDYNRIYESSWKNPEPYSEFIPGLVKAAADRGWLRLGVAYVDDEPAAAQIWIVCGGTASIYKVAYDARFAKLSVGTILTAKMMEYVIDSDRVSVVDYLTGDDEYKREWMTHRRERWGIIAFNPWRLRGAWLAVRNIGGRALKKLIESRAARQ